MLEDELNKITESQVKRQEDFKSVSNKGQKIEYLGKKFVVYKNVFWPFYDSKPLVENFTINPGEYVLDVCTGSGVIAVFSASKGAKKVVALDVSLDAIKAAKVNAKQHSFTDLIDVRLSDMFEAVEDDERFDVITGNLPFRNIKANNQVESTMWDTELAVHKKFFRKVDRYLKLKGRIYLSQSNFGAVEEMKKLANESGFIVKLIGKQRIPDDKLQVFYAFELTRNTI